MSAPRIAGALRLHARFLADKEAVVGAGGAVTYAALVAGIDRLAGHLLDQGIGPGQRVGLALQPSAHHLAAMVALWEIGAVVCPLNTRLTADEATDLARRLVLTHVLVDPPNAALGAVAPARVAMAGPDVGFADATPAGGTPPAASPCDGTAPAPDGAAPAVAFPTGGTTGAPKAALWSGSGIDAIVASNCMHLGVRRQDRELYMSPFFHVSVVTGLLPPLWMGGTVRLADPADPDDALGAIAAGGVTRLFAVPAVLERLMSTSRPVPTGGLRAVVYGASGSTAGFVERVAQLFPAAGIMTGYGASEFGPVTRAYPDEVVAGDAGVGRPVTGAWVGIVDDDGRAVADGAAGEIVVRAPWQMLGYLGTDEVPWWGDGAIRTGDIGVLRDGYLHLQGRRKELIKSGGEQVFPAEVEAVVARHPAVVAAAAYGTPDGRWGERVECAVVLRAGATLGPDELRTHCRAALAGFKVPKRFVVVDELPLTSNHKIDRRALQGAAGGA